MVVPTVQACARCLQGLLLAAMLTGPALLMAQEPKVSLAVLKAHARKTAADSGKVFLMLKVAGVPDERLRALKYTDVVIQDSENRTYRAEAVAIPAHDGAATENFADRCYLFTIPSKPVNFELRLPTFKPIRFTATYSMTRTCSS